VGKVTKCVCYDQSFKELKELIDQHKIQTAEELTEYADAGGGCRMCAPYIALVILTGKTEFDVSDV